MSIFKSILVLCEGNHCRSPIAEALLREALPPEIRVASAGLRAMVGQHVHPYVLNQMAGLGLDLSGHRGRQLTPAMALSADLILVMDAQQKDECGRKVPGTRGRIFLLSHWVSTPAPAIEDPMHKDAEAFRVALEKIQNSVASWLPHMTIDQRLA